MAPRKPKPVDWESPEEKPEEEERLPFKHTRDSLKSRLPAPLIENMTADEIVERLAMFGGDIYAFTASLGRINGTREIVISKALGILGKPENSRQMFQWSDLLKQFKTTQMIIMQRKAIKHLKGMPKPTKESNLNDWVKYGNFWSDVDTGLEEKGKNTAREEQVRQQARKDNMQALIEGMKGNKGE